MLPGISGFLAAEAAAPVQLFDYTDHEVAVGTDAGTLYQLQSSGDINVSSGGGVGIAILGQWLLSGSPGDYEARMTVLSGAFSGGPVNIWGSPLQLWHVTRTIPGTSFATGLLELRRIGGGAILAHANISLTSTVETTA